MVVHTIVLSVSVWGGGWGGVIVHGPVGSVDTVWESSAVDEDWLAFVHDPLDVGLRVAVKLNDGSVESLFSLLSSKAVLEV